MINVNLLPPELKEEIRIAKKNRKTLSNYWKTVWVLLGTVVLIIMPAYYFWQLSKTYDGPLAEAESSVSKYKNLEVKAGKEQEKLTKIKSILASSNQWSGVLEELNRVMGTNTVLTNLRLDSTKNARQSITGELPNRDAVIGLRDRMEESKFFQYVDIDSTTTKLEKNGSSSAESFIISFSLEEGVLK